jgi:hypothetical protein
MIGLYLQYIAVNLEVIFGSYTRGPGLISTDIIKAPPPTPPSPYSYSFCTNEKGYSGSIFTATLLKLVDIKLKAAGPSGRAV